jgi:hypothetical protein
MIHTSKSATTFKEKLADRSVILNGSTSARTVVAAEHVTSPRIVALVSALSAVALALRSAGVVVRTPLQ